MPLTPLRRLSVALVLVASAAWASPAHSQATGPALELTPEEAEAYTMSRELQFNCNPQRHRTIQGTQSVVRRGDSTFPGTAALVRSAEGTFLILEGYDQSLFGHCLVLGWFGGDLEVGRHQIRQLAMSAMEEEVGSEDHAFYAMPAVRTDGENSILVAVGGTLELDEVGDQLTGSFDFTGFTVAETGRTEDVTWEGSFSAVEVER